LGWESSTAVMLKNFLRREELDIPLNNLKKV